MELMEILFVLAILLLIFGPEKLPKLARELGEAVYEFRKASSGILASSAAKNAIDVKRALEDTAKKLNIKTEGKTIKQITREIIVKVESETVET